MGRSYWFECSRCGYRAKVAGGADRGLHFYVQTILCQDCKELYDAVTRMRMPERNGLLGEQTAFIKKQRQLSLPKRPGSPPSFQAALNRLIYAGMSRGRWVPFRLQCPVSSVHRVKAWNDPDKCPRCAYHLDKNPLPYRIWE
ncbi:MAG TPA: hypothetical protein VG167_13505 [Verrucomicrobiae bacterium]|nr:hypothetical protein [Verrucomicrobiae bacterium]